MKMKLLGWDTSSKAGALVALEWDTQASIARWEDVRLVSELAFNVDSTHSERLVWGIHQVLEAARWKLEEVDVFAVGVGPGSFTGLRIGITTARTLAHLYQKPLVSVSSLAALARPVAAHFSQLSLDFETWILATTDACKGELFALWGKSQNVVHCVDSASGAPSPVWQDSVSEKVLEPQQLLAHLEQSIGAGSRWIAVGEGRKRYPEIWSKLAPAQELHHGVLFSDFVQGRYLGQLAWQSYQSGCFQQGLLVFPRYLRASDAELKLQAGLLKPSPVRKFN